MPKNLLVIVAIQAIVFALASLALRKSTALTQLNWPIAIGVGVGFGISMDLVLGAYGIFGYLLNSDQSTPVDPRNLPAPVLLFNAVASYGLASLSVALLAPNLVISCKRTRNWSVRLALACIAGLFAVIVATDRSLSMMFAWGAVIVFTGELALYIGGKTGPVLALLAGKDYRPLLRLTIFSACLGSLYEIANARFPFWVWLPGSDLPPFNLAALVALIGYLALFHPMASIYVSLVGDPNTNG